jgi:hypothetical protein
MNQGVVSGGKGKRTPITAAGGGRSFGPMQTNPEPAR